MLKYRLISAFILLPIIIATLFLLSPVGFAIVALIICIIAAWEWGLLSGFASYSERFYLLLFCMLLLVLPFFLSSHYYLNIYQTLVTSLLWLSLWWWITALFLVLFYPDSAELWRHSKVLCFIFGLFIIIPFFWGMLVLRTWHYDENHHKGALYLLYIMILVWGTDSGSYIFGKLLGKHKLIPKISPGKTWQGFVGGLFTSAVISCIYSTLVNLEIKSPILLVCSILAVLASILGDLTESMFKREARVKDSGCLIPGHGGILDCIDSLMAAVPVFACLLLLVFKAI